MVKDKKRDIVGSNNIFLKITIIIFLKKIMLISQRLWL
jgi:hypothetical protein